MKTVPIKRQWTVKRTVVEEFAVMARSKKEALLIVLEDPNKITVIKTTATKS